MPDQSQDIPFFIQDADLLDEGLHEESDVVSSLGTVPSSALDETSTPYSAAHPPQLEVLDITGKPHQNFTLNAPRTLIGREGADLVLPDHPFVAKFHAQLLWDQDSLVLETLHPTTPVFLAIADAFALEDGDEIMAGYQRFLFHTKTAPPTFADSSATMLGAPESPNMPHLIRLLKNGFIGGLYPFYQTMTIGRNDAEVRCPNDPLLGDLHASITQEGDAFVLRDEGSRYGTFIRVHQPLELFSGDIFMIGHMRLRVYV